MNFDFGYIKSITDNFSEERKVGSGGYGDVYRVEMANHYTSSLVFKCLHFHWRLEKGNHDKFNEN